MSEAYVAEAREHLRGRPAVRLLVGDATRIPLPDASQDAVTCIFLFHELPPGVRRAAFGEFARVLKPAGRLVLVDSLQRGDAPEYDGLLELFPQSFHEPYYTTYIAEDFVAMARACNLAHRRSVRAFVSKVMVFDKG
jgi:ubiquinone/menaquinone biosynthesis C-methylase UbiE